MLDRGARRALPWLLGAALTTPACAHHVSSGREAASPSAPTTRPGPTPDARGGGPPDPLAPISLEQRGLDHDAPIRFRPWRTRLGPTRLPRAGGGPSAPPATSIEPPEPGSPPPLGEPAPDE